MKVERKQYRRASKAVALATVLVATLVAGASAQTGGWQISPRDSRLAAAGSLSVVATTHGLVSSGDKFVGDSVLVLKAPMDVTLRFFGFGSPSNGSIAPFTMRTRLEVGGSGVLYDGAAEGLNGMALPLPTRLAPNGIALKLSREIQATASAPAGRYVNDAIVTVSTM